MTDEHPTTSLPADANGATLTFDGVVDAIPVESFGDYELTSEIARGGMGVVLRGRQIKLNRPVAVKMLLAGSFATATERERFRHEAEAAAGLEHPHILPVYEVGEQAGRAYFSMKLVDGGTLASLLKSRPRPDTRNLVALLAKVCRAVDHAHRRGILHRDLKPSNVLLDADSTPYVADFGLAKRADSDDLLTKTGAVVGTPSYMAPEQARGEKGLTTAVDIYSLAAILYEILAGRPPFVAETPMATLRKVIDDPPSNPRSTMPDADRDLSVVALKGLQKEPARRYASAAALADDIDRWLRGDPVVARPTTSRERLVRWARRNPVQAALSASLGAALFFGTFFSIRYAVEANRQKRAADQNLVEVQRLAEEANQALRDVSLARQDAIREQGKAQFSLCLSRIDQARAVRLAGQAGWRTTALELLYDAARMRPKLDPAQGTLNLSDLRGEAIASLLRHDARMVRTIPSGINDTPLISGDGTLVISKFMKPNDGQMIFGFRGVQVADGRQAFSHESKLVALDLEAAASPDYLRTMNLFNGQLSVNTGGTQLLTNGLLGTELGLVDVKTATIVKTLKPTVEGAFRFFAPAFSPDGRTAIAWQLHPKTALTLVAWDLSKDAPARVVANFRNDERLTLEKFDAADAPPCGFTPRGDVWHVTPDRHTLVVNAGTGSAAKLTTRDISGLLAVAWHPTLPRLAAIVDTPMAQTKVHQLVIWDTAEKKELLRRNTMPFEGSRSAADFLRGSDPIAFSRDGRFLAVCEAGGIVAIHDATTGRERLRFATGAFEGVQRLGWTAGNELLVKPIMEAIQLWRIDIDDNLTRSLDPGTELKVKAVSPDGKWLVAVPHSGGGVIGVKYKAEPVKAMLIDAATGKLVNLSDSAANGEYAFRPDGKTLALISGKSLVEFALPDGRELRRLPPPKYDGYDGWRQVHYRPDGRLMATLNPDLSKNFEKPLPFLIWDAEAGTPLVRRDDLTAARFAVNLSTLFSPRGDFAVLNPNTSMESFMPFVKSKPREDWQMIGLQKGDTLGKIPHAQFGTGDVMLEVVSPDGRWLGVGTMSLAAGNDLAIGEVAVQFHKLPGGERIARCNVKPIEEDDAFDFAATQPVALLQQDKLTLELWLLEPTAQRLATWQPYGNRRVADCGFLGDSIFLRADGQTAFEIIPLDELRRKLQSLQLDW